MSTNWLTWKNRHNTYEKYLTIFGTDERVKEFAVKIDMVNIIVGHLDGKTWSLADVYNKMM